MTLGLDQESLDDVHRGPGFAVQPGERVSAEQAAFAPLPRRQPGSHGAKAVKADPAAADPATLRKVLDGLNRI